MNEDIPTINTGTDSINNPNNKILGKSQFNYKLDNEKFQNILKKWIARRCLG